MRGPSLAAAIALSGCLYGPGSYHLGSTSFAGKRVALPCLDVAVTLTDDARATSPVVQYTFGNRCAHAAIVDLGAVRAIGRSPDGSEIALRPYDPRHELRALRLDAWWAGSEELMYVTAAGDSAPDVLCIDVGAIEHAPEHWVCLGAAS